MSGDVLEFLDGRRTRTNERLNHLRDALQPSEALVSDHTCVYATGSIGRGEASSYSDLDAFILYDGEARHAGTLDVIQSALIDAAEAARFPPFSDDGTYLKPHVLPEMIQKLGSRDDDYENLFTARMLLLLESQPLVGNAMYSRAIETILGEYWKDYDDNADIFLPVYLTNDIIRYWKVLCLNYEQRTRSADDAKRRLLNYKLKHSRLLTCYSAILHMCNLLRTQTSISPDHALRMTRLTPINRLLSLAEGDQKSERLVKEMLRSYVSFLQTTDAEKGELLKRFSDDTSYRKYRADGIAFGDVAFELLKHVGEQTRLFRYLVV